LENPTLCDRSAIDAARDNASCSDNARSTSSVNHASAKREHAVQTQIEGKEPRRRLT
jgi:hypothetical protein